MPKFQVKVSEEHSITSVQAQLETWPSLAVLEVNSEMRGVADLCPLVHVGIQNTIEKLPKKTRVFYLNEIENDPQWFVKVVDELPEHVYFTVNPASLSWEKILDLSREVTHRRNIVAMDVLGSCPQQRIDEILAVILNG